MRIIGIDPGTATTGFSIIEILNRNIQLLEYGIISTKAGLPQSTRLDQIAKDLQTIIEKWSPSEACIEKLYFEKNIKTAMTVSEARGVIIQTLYSHGVNCHEMTPTQIKSTICGYGAADKQMVQEMVKRTLNLKEIPTPDDAADAIAAALCLAYQTKTPIPQKTSV
ncbi:crossover junction endodeoxyribonuclease RuvC [Candidatus Peregrinibacteria bacterium HGW-Peregrinibacteria-1]|jgi:crossover junction endodeoxyribonuclease RuvC|nr:MAG: crossover junction endodeoxyribonuclease RuvC [Candidatus Peregrinibacteria bacterium HGW-Peregrinibacteria-1]